MNEEKGIEAMQPAPVPESKKIIPDEAVKVSRPQSNWADQLKKAMQAIEHTDAN